MKSTRSKGSSSAGRPKQRQSNIRGRISGPIPIPDPADDEFPMRGEPSTPALGTPLASEPPPPPPLLPPSQLPFPQDPNASAVDAQSTNGHVHGATPVERAETRSQAGTAYTSDNTGSIGKRRTVRSSNVRYSTGSHVAEGDRDAAPQRKKSTLRSAFSKIFGRKKKTATDGAMLETHLEDPASSKQHQSDPTTYGRSLPMEGGGEPKRSVSLPVTDYDRALRSHSLGPDDMMAIESARNSIQVDPMRFRRRAATTSSRIYDTRSRDFGDLQGLTPRPASAHGRSSLEAAGDDSPENIGRAITSDILTLHRRSRSLSQLYEAAATGGKVQRKRSDEIRYWRESYDPGFHSPTSSNLDLADDPAVLHLIGDAVDAVGPESPVETASKTPSRPFNFEPVTAMKITQAASLEERMAAMETHNQKLERLVTQLFQLIPGTNDYPDSPIQRNAPVPTAPSISNTTNHRNAPTDPRASSQYSTSRHSNESFGDGVTFVGSVPTSFGPSNRPTSLATVRGATSLPSLPRSLAGPFTADHYTTLLALIETERSARQALEAQVNRLATQLHLVTRRSERFDGMGPGALQSAFELDEDEMQGTPVTESGSEAFKTPREEQPQHGFGAFGEELKEEGSEGKRAARTLSLSQLTLKKPHKTRPQQVGVNL